MNINGTALDNLIFNGQQVDTVVFNGVEVWNRISLAWSDPYPLFDGDGSDYDAFAEAQIVFQADGGINLNEGAFQSLNGPDRYLSRILAGAGSNYELRVVDFFAMGGNGAGIDFSGDGFGPIMYEGPDTDWFSLSTDLKVKFWITAYVETDGEVFGVIQIREKGTTNMIESDFLFYLYASGG